MQPMKRTFVQYAPLPETPTTRCSSPRRTTWIPAPPTLSTASLTILIARLHVSVQARCVRGQQYRNTGPVINFFADTGKIYSVLYSPFTSAGSRDGPPPACEYGEQQRRSPAISTRLCRRTRVQQWLDWLKQHHPGY